MKYQGLTPIGIWNPDGVPPAFSADSLLSIIPRIREPVHIVQQGPYGRLGIALSGQVSLQREDISDSTYLLLGTIPALYPEWLGDRSFLEVHRVRFPYVAGAMFRSIASPEMVIAMAHAGMIGFFGAAGMSVEGIEMALNKIESSLGNSGLSWGSNLIHSPVDPEMEEAVVDLYLRRGVQRVSAAAFMTLTPSAVRYASTGLQADSSGRIHRRNHLFAKLSRPEVAGLFMSPAPNDILNHLVSQGKITQMEATLAARIPVAEDITVEADSGGHTDNRPLIALFPTILALRDEKVAHHGYTRPIRVGAAGGLGTPSAVASAFSMGAAYVLTGSVNQAAVESGISPESRQMLAMADIADFAMAPAGDMFEMGIKVQVLKKGTMFSSRATQLYQLYTTYDSLDTIPSSIKARLEKEIFRAPLEEIWSETSRFFEQRNPKEIEKAEQNPKYRMSLLFRWYLGNACQWAIDGNPERHIDYQILCGPSMGAFNTWVHGSFLAKPENRTVANIALNLLEGAAVVTRAQQLRSFGVPIPESAFYFPPRPLS